MKPILFNTEMVQAILDGRKTVTRRIIKPQPGTDQVYPLGCCVDGDRRDIGKFGIGSCESGGRILYVRPPYKTGDILYVRETWRLLNPYGDYQNDTRQADLEYKADRHVEGVPIPREWEKYLGNKWHPSIHMPKEAARIWLKVTAVWVERLREITDEQAKEEGANWKNGKNVGWEEKMRRTSIDRFAELWDSTIKKSDIDRYGWEANPWVWVIAFERCEKPEENE